MAASPKAIGKWVTQVVRRPEAYAILGPMIPEKRNSWTRGGCCVLAMALQRYLRRGQLMMLIRDGELVHVVLELDGYFIDADGAHTEDELENEWGRIPVLGSSWRNAIVLPFDGEKLAHDGVECPDPTPMVRYFRKVGKGVRFSSAGGPWYGGGMANYTRGSSFSPTMRVDYGTRRAAKRAPRPTMPSSWKRVSIKDCTLFLPPGRGGNNMAILNNGGQPLLACPQGTVGDARDNGCNVIEFPAGRSDSGQPAVAPNLIYGHGTKDSYYDPMKVLPKISDGTGYAMPCPWYLFNKSSVSRGGSIIMETNMGWKSVQSARVGNRALSATRISEHKIRFRVPMNWPHNFLFSTVGNGLQLVIRGVGSGPVTGGPVPTSNLVVTPRVHPYKIRVTGSTQR